MKKTHMLRGVTGWFAPSLVFAAILGCGGGTDSSPADTAGSAKAQSPAGQGTAAEQATLLDVLRLTDKAIISYKGGISGNTMGSIYSTGPLAWDGLSFSCDNSFVIDKGMDEEQSRQIKVQGRIADDFASLKEMHVDVTSVTKANGTSIHDRFTFRDIPVNEDYATPRKDWRSRPIVRYTTTCNPREIANHLEGWQTESKDSAQVTTTSNQKELLLVYMPGKTATFKIEVIFANKAY